MPTGPRNCHDVTSYPAMNLLAASCSTHSILVDISNPEKPFRLDALTDTNNFQGRHTAAFSNDGKKLIQTDEWGGGTGPMCQASSMIELGGNTVITLDAKKKQTQRAYFKLPSAQSAEENCVSHNGGIIPVPGRDLYVQGWYQGGVNIMDFTDPDKRLRDRVLRSRLHQSADDRSTCRGRRPGTPDVRGGGNTIGGSWGAYYWNGLIFSSELDRGMDILELTPSAQLSANEIAAAKLVRFNEYNPQSQPKMTWPRGVRRRAVVSRPAGAERRARGGAHDGDRRRARRGGDEDWRGSCDGAERARAAGGQGCRRCEGRCARADDGRRDPAAGGGVEVGRSRGARAR